MDAREITLTLSQMELCAEFDENAHSALRFGRTFKRRQFFIIVCGGIVAFGAR